jgi:hypothetical protein
MASGVRVDIEPPPAASVFADIRVMRVHGMMKGNEFIFQWSGSDYLARVHCIGRGS